MFRQVQANWVMLRRKRIFLENSESMKLQHIDKALYRSNMNLFMMVLVLALIICSLGFGAGLIALFGVEAVPGEPTGNFHWNLLGVILAALLCSAIVYQLKTQPFLKEIYYVWQLKQLQNRIYRKLNKIKAAATSNDINALITLLFYFTSLRQVYLLDDNTLTLSAVDKELTQVQEQCEALGLTLSAEQFEVELLAGF
ncbi:hypothetical protein DIKCMJMK_01954 [Shewanella oneidensis]|nr:hypothetical protein [Shewanella oneidensis]